MIRLIVVFIIILLAIFFSSDNLNIDYKKRRKYYIIIISILLILHSGLRNLGVGSDTFQYNLIFENVRAESWNEIINNLLAYEGKEPFYNLFQKVFQYFSTDYQLYLLFVAAIFMPALGYFIYKNISKH